MLARESSSNKVNWCEVVLSNFSDISKPFYVGPVFLKNTITVIVNLDLPGAFHPGTLKAKINTAYTGE